MNGRFGRITQCFLGSTALVLLVGCGGGGPNTQYVEGIVTLDGKPIEGVTVGFSPNDQTGVPAVGRTDAAGVYKLTAQRGGEPNEGTTEGTYSVSFMKTTVEGAGGGMTYEETEAIMNDPNYGKEDAGGGISAPPKVTHEVPVGYNNPATSGFTVTVKRGENKGGDFNFDLKSDFTAK